MINYTLIMETFNKAKRNLWNYLSFIPKYFSDTAQEVLLVYENEDGTELEKRVPNLALQKKGDEEWKSEVDETRHKVHKFKLDLRHLDPEKMYPVVYRYGNGVVLEGESWGEISIGRHYGFDRDLNNGGNSSTRFSDGYESSNHVASLECVLLGNDTSWGGAGWAGEKIQLLQTKYMNTLQFAGEYRMRIFVQEMDSTSFSSDNSVIPTETSPYHSGFWLRGGLSYRGYCKNLALLPKLFEEATLLYVNTSYGRTEWVAPIPYNPSNNPQEVNRMGGFDG